MSSALKQVIINAIVKVSGENPSRDLPGEPTAEQARDDFIRLLIAELFPENPSVPAVKEKKKPGPKPKLDENGQPIRKPRSPKSVVSPDSLASSQPKAEPKAESPKEKKPRAPMSEEAKAAMVAKRKATLEAKKAAAGEAPATPKKETPALPASPPKAPKKAKKAAEPEASPKKSPKKAAEPEAKKAAEPQAKKAAEPQAKKAAEPEAKKAAEPQAKKAKKPSAEPASANLDKFTPTQKKKLVEIAGDKADKKDVLSYLNGLSNAAFHDKKLEDHFRDYVASLAPPAPEPAAEEKELVRVEFDGESYAVDRETNRVYTVDENGNATGVGYVGMGKFEKLEVPEDDSESEGEE